MKLTFGQPHLSLRNFPETDLPDLVLLTGVNGSGKTHLLQAIQSGLVQVDEASSPGKDIRSFNWNTLVPNDTGATTNGQLSGQRFAIIQRIEQAKNELLPQLRKISHHLKSVKADSGLWALTAMSKEQILEELKDPAAIGSVTGIVRRVSAGLLSLMRQGQGLRQQEIIQDLAKQKGSPALIDETDMLDLPLGWSEPDLFKQSFGVIFQTYFEKLTENELKEMAVSKGRSVGSPPLSEEEFVGRHGAPPWDFVNEVLRDCRLDFQISQPTDYFSHQFQPELTKTTTGDIVRFGELSSGEQILMSFAFCLYYSTDERQLAGQPKLLLFDEIDAPLHPSMSRTLVETISKSLVEKRGVRVIMTTHSPSTIAVAPEESIYTMSTGVPGLVKTTKRRAIAMLTSEIPTMSIDFEGRRQVFVESGFDVKRYEMLYRHLSGKIDSERSLTFLSSGRPTRGGGEEGAGCDRVKSIVSELNQAGNNQVFGVVDWDGRSKSEGNLLVLAEGSRYAIENCLLDPLLVAAAVAREKPLTKGDVGLLGTERHFDLESMTSERLQDISNIVQNSVLKDLDSEDEPERWKCIDGAGRATMVDRRYLTMQGHRLESRILDVYPMLKRYTATGKLLEYIVEIVLPDVLSCIPSEIVEAMERLLSMEVQESD